MLRDLVLKNRSYRRFQQDAAIDMDTLREVVDLARLSASAANVQPLRYILSCDPARNSVIFSHLAWAAYLKDWPGPAEGDRPAAYIVVLEDTRLGHPCRCDHGIAAQTILLGATEKGLGGCMIGSVDKKGLRRSLEIPDGLDVLLVLALGRPKEEVVLETVGGDGDIKYWRDSSGVHHVPKRALDDIIVG
jgi:nitroreductase